MQQEDAKGENNKYVGNGVKVSRQQVSEFTNKQEGEPDMFEIKQTQTNELCDKVRPCQRGLAMCRLSVWPGMGSPALARRSQDGPCGTSRRRPPAGRRTYHSAGPPSQQQPASSHRRRLCLLPACRR